MHNKAQTSLLVVNVLALTMFFVGVCVIVHNEERIDMPDTPTVRSELDFESRDVAVVVTEAPDHSRACEPSKGCKDEKSIVAPILFAFLAGGIMNLPELTSLPCI